MPGSGPQGGERPPPVHADTDIQAIAEGLGLSVAQVDAVRHELDAAATWYRLDASADSLFSTLETAKVLGSMELQVRKMSAKLDEALIFDAILIDGTPAPDGSWDERDQAAMDRIVGALGELQERCSTAAASIRSRGARAGRVEDSAINDWLRHVLPIYEKLTGRRATTTYNPIESRGDGPLIAFVIAASRPLGLRRATPTAWRSRIERVLAGRKRLK